MNHAAEYALSIVASHTCAPLSLLSKEQHVQECDATYDAMENKSTVHKKNNLMNT